MLLLDIYFVYIYHFSGQALLGGEGRLPDIRPKHHLQVTFKSLDSDSFFWSPLWVTVSEMKSGRGGTTRAPPTDPTTTPPTPPRIARRPKRATGTGAKDCTPEIDLRNHCWSCWHFPTDVPCLLPWQQCFSLPVCLLVNITVSMLLVSLQFQCYWSHYQSFFW